MKKAALPAALVVVTAGIVAGIVAYVSGDSRLAALAPQTTTFWFETADLKKTLARAKKTEAWKDFERSPSFAEFEKRWETLVRLSSTSEKFKDWRDLGLRLNETTVLSFIGQNAGFGAISGDGSQPPALYVMTKIDVVGLAKDIAVDGDWTKVWEKLQTLLGGKDVKLEKYKGYDIATRTISEIEELKGRELHFCMIETTIVASDTKAAIEQVVDVKVGDAKSLAEKKAFKTEQTRIKKTWSGADRADKVGYAWVDLAYLRDPERVKKVVHALGERVARETTLLEKDAKKREALQETIRKEFQRFTGEELKVLIDDLQPDVDGLALALHLPDGDIYRGYLTGSRGSADLFVDNAEQDVRALIEEDPFFLVEAKQAYDLALAFTRSKTLDTLLQTEAAKWLKARLDDPDQLTSLAGDASPVDLDKNPTFELRTLLAALQVFGKELGGERGALAVQVKQSEKPEEAFRPLFLYRSRPAARIALDLALGTLAAHSKLSSTTAKTHNGRQVFAFEQEGLPIQGYATRIGADFVFSTRRELVETAIDRAAKGAKPKQGGPFDGAVGKLPKDYQLLAYLDFGQLDRVLKPALKKAREKRKRLQEPLDEPGVKKKKKKPAKPDAGPSEEQVDTKLVEAFDGQLGAGAFVLYTAKDFTAGTLRSAVSFGPKASAIKELVTNGSTQAVWERIPQNAFLSFAARVDPQRTYAWLNGVCKDVLGAQRHSEGLAKLEKDSLGGRSLEKDLIGHMGPLHGLALTVQDKVLPEGMPQDHPRGKRILAIPAALGYLQLKDGPAFQKVLLHVVKHLLAKTNEERSGGKEKQAIKDLQKIAKAQDEFKQGDMDGDGKLNYAGRLEDLGKHDLVDAELASGFSTSGYKYKLQVSPDDPEYKWMALASPFQGEPGRHFMVNHDGKVFHSTTPFDLNDTCAPPKGAVTIDKPLPGAKTKKDPNDPNLFRLAEKKVGGTTVYRLILPEKERGLLGPAKDAFGPCFAVADGFLLLATSEPAIAQALAAKSGQNLAGSSSFQKALEGHPREVVSAGHVSWAGLIDQVKRNGEYLALEYASPDKAAGLKPPVMPEWSPKVNPEEFDKKYEAYEAAKGEHAKKVKEWRSKHAAENAAQLGKILDSLKVLGTFVETTGNDGHRFTALTQWKLDLPAKK